MFDYFKKTTIPQAQVLIQFPSNFESTLIVSVQEEGPMPIGFENWIWDLYYAKTLYNLGENAISNGLKEQMEEWAEQWAGALLSPLPLPEEALILDLDLTLLDKKLNGEYEEYRVEIIKSNREWPTIQTYLPNKGFQNRVAYSVLALAQYLINKDKKHNFSRELSIHLLALKRFYANHKPYTSMRSVIEAPTFAVNAAMEVFERLGKDYMKGTSI